MKQCEYNWHDWPTYHAIQPGTEEHTMLLEDLLNGFEVDVTCWLIDRLAPMDPPITHERVEHALYYRGEGTFELDATEWHLYHALSILRFDDFVDFCKIPYLNVLAYAFKTM